MKNWKKLFSKTILDRGYEYYLEGAVENIDKEDDVISATVSGTELYKVEIYLDNGEVNDMKCDCPYAEGGNYCKHMAAVLYEFEDAGSDINPAVKETVTDMVNAADEAVVKAFLAEILKNDDKLKQRFLLKVSKPKTSVDAYKKLIDATIYEHEDDWGFIDYQEASDFYVDMEAFADDIRIMIDNGQYRDAYELSFYICQQVAGIDSDDDGEMTMLLDDFSAFWAEIAEKMSPPDKDWLFEQALLEYELCDNEFLDDYLEAFVTKEFREERFHDRVIGFIDTEINTAEPDSYQRSSALRRMADYLNDTKTAFDKTEKFCREHWEDIHMREWLASQFAQRDEWQKAIEIYEECISSETSHPGSVKRYREELLRLYRKTGNTEKAMEILWDLVCQLKCYEYYDELKSQYSEEEWIQKREEVFSAFAGYGQARLLCEEKLYDRLWEHLKEENLFTVLGYEDVLLPKHSAEILRKYSAYLNQAATQASGRKAYQEWVRLLKRMEKIDGGKELAKQIAENWRIKYKNRSAMMDELRKL